MIASKNIRMGPITQFWTNDKQQDFKIAKNLTQLLVSNLGQRRIHHQYQSDGNGNVGGIHLKEIDKVLNTRK